MVCCCCLTCVDKASTNRARYIMASAPRILFEGSSPTHTWDDSDKHTNNKQNKQVEER